jgi:hypothetical protein
MRFDFMGAFLVRTGSATELAQNFLVFILGRAGTGTTFLDGCGSIQIRVTHRPDRAALGCRVTKKGIN